MKLPWLDPLIIEFPDTRNALKEPNGLLCAGGALSTEWLLKAYKEGIFPWFNEGDPILWWTPSPRMVIYPYQFHISRSLRKALKKGGYQVTINKDFEAVIAACANSRRDNTSSSASSTWITSAITESYLELHAAGHAHSVEVWQDNVLCGGLYGIAIGRVFFGESMFSLMTNGSKIAIAHLVEYLKKWQYKLIDCQVHNDHLNSLGAIEIDRISFEQIIRANAREANICHPINEWTSQDITLENIHWAKEKPNF
jgi:leucyl/phenylalanyl-tRNA--protein transferase